MCFIHPDHLISPSIWVKWEQHFQENGLSFSCRSFLKLEIVFLEQFRFFLVLLSSRLMAKV